VFGTHNIGQLPVLLERARIAEEAQVEIVESLETFPSTLPSRRESAYAAWVAVSVGCNNTCTFCIVPALRGKEKDRRPGDVLAEVEALVAEGVIEVTLLGQNVNAYRGPMKTRDGADGGVCDLALLIHILARFDTLGRIRFTTSHPAEFGDGLIEAFALEPKLAGYLHLPVQSGSDRILGMMKRGYTRAQYLEKIRRLREARPDLALSSDFIVGFPGETEADFEQTMQLIEEARFDSAFSFIYSARPGTPAANLKDSLPDAIKHERLERLQARIRELGGEYMRARLGTRQTVLVEKPAVKNEHWLAGRSGCNRWVNFPAPAGQAPALIGRFVELEITEVMPNSYRGRLIGGEGTPRAQSQGQLEVS
jgi:tRNA-2-methylthio-N6-dimethylallyladenosine synthase